ncbi:MAG: hypothetical protein AAF560_11455 [Acidobacteriota bacterium]
MQRFADVLHALLQRIRAVPNKLPRERHTCPLYRVATTSWGCEDQPPAAADPRTASNPRSSGVTSSREPSETTGSRRELPHASRHSLELTVYGLPVPRGLPST